MPYALPVACCASDALCTECRSNRFAHLRGVAACRGEVWAMSLVGRVDRALPWPTGSDKVLAIARVTVADLTRDEGLREMLAMETARWAERWWSTPTAAC